MNTTLTPASSCGTLHACDGLITLESTELRAVVDPAAGGKIRSLRALKSGREFFFQDQHAVPSDTDFSAHDITGCDECFPTVAPCSITEGPLAGFPLGDHGLLWNRPWSHALEAHALRMHVDLPELGIRFERSCALSAVNELTLHYTMSHSGRHALPYIYSLHPLLQGDPDTQLRLPPGDDDRLYIEAALNSPGLPTRDWAAHASAIIQKSSTPPFDTGRNACLKYFIPQVREGSAALVYPATGDRLTLTFDTQALPHLGVLIYEGYAGNVHAPYCQSLFFALEPTTGIGDELEGARRTNSIATLNPGESKSWWIRFTLENERPFV